MTEPDILASNPKLTASSVGLLYPDAPHKLFEGLSFELRAGELLAITGGNSCGKSSLINCLCGIIPKSITATLEGRITLNGISLEEIPLCEVYRHISVVLANAGDQLLMPTVELELAFALENMGLASAEIRLRVERAAARFGLESLLQASPRKLSGGEQRKLLFAICECMETPILMLDEPETGLSGKALDLLCDWLNELREDGRGIIIASHNPRLISMADTTIALDKHRV